MAEQDNGMGNVPHKEHKMDESDKFFLKQELFYNKHMRPAIRQDVKDEFSLQVLPFAEKMDRHRANNNITIGGAYVLIICLFLIMLFGGCREHAMNILPAAIPVITVTSAFVVMVIKENKRTRNTELKKKNEGI